ncbi:peptidase M50 [Thermincola ferriacetica]|uniref:Peptidase M50 n=1 Tax=Thermincola ferriacetica TaxID=281456 RepID=A0A0L6W2F4_9FIRM|nr:M50 family metallopeptidase [Thermincola ferriacetica]KNZ69558.1 peptidase M50 [Thermincola ferriacetica]
MKIAKVFGINVKVNTFFLVLFLVLILTGKYREGLIVFGVVLLHELAHVVTALNYKFRVTEVELLPYGGVAKLEQGLEGDPYAEIFISLAGPLANFLIIGLLYMLEGLGIWNQRWVPFFIECNLTLGLFNLLPAYPLDGGRIYRALLTERFGLTGATDRARKVSLILSLLMVFLGVGRLVLGLNGINLIVIGVFLAFENFRDKGSIMFAFIRYLNRKQQDLPVRRLMLARHVVALEDVQLKELVRHFVPQKYNLVVRVDSGQRITGVFSEHEIISKLLEGKINMTLGEL